jgi:hypothetical protein
MLVHRHGNGYSRGAPRQPTQQALFAKTGAIHVAGGKRERPAPHTHERCVMATVASRILGISYLRSSQQELRETRV